MRDPNRIYDVLDMVGALWQKNPDMRLGQLLINISGLNDIHDLFNLEDDKLVVLIKGKAKGWNNGG